MSIDFTIFDLTNEANVLRILCGAFFIPHMFGKLANRTLTSDLFRKAGFNPAEPFVWLALGIEFVLVLGLIFAVYTTIVALLAAAFLACSAVANYRLSGGKWYWHLGGYEYTTFWMLVCLVVAMHG